MTSKKIKPKYLQINQVEIDPQLMFKSNRSEQRQKIRFDNLGLKFQVNALSCILYGKHCIENKINKLDPRIKRKNQVLSYVIQAKQFLKFHPSLMYMPKAQFFQNIQEKFINIRIIIFQNHIGENRSFTGPLNNSNKNKNVYLVESDEKKNIYNVLKYPAAYFRYRFLCPTCIKFSNNKIKHLCIFNCPKCEGYCGPSTKYKCCPDCNRVFKSKQCFLNHLNSKVCNIKKRCKDCKMDYVIPKSKRKQKIFKHKCTEVKCKWCKSVHKLGRCFVRGREENYLNEQDPERKTKNVIYFDIETIQHKNGKL